MKIRHGEVLNLLEKDGSTSQTGTPAGWQIRLAKEHGELISRAEQLVAFESAGRTIARAIQMLPSWAEESGICGLSPCAVMYPMPE
jgi:hypothetical protein